MLIFMIEPSRVNKLARLYQHKSCSFVVLCDLAFANKVNLNSGFFLIEILKLLENTMGRRDCLLPSYQIYFC